MAREKDLDNTYCVYCHTNKINGKKYIGITGMNPNKRWRNGKSYTNKHFLSAISKYGWDNFEHEILFNNLSKDMACKKEIELISKYDTTNPSKGYNLSTGGENPARGAHWVLSDETKRKMSNSAKGEKNGFYGKHFTDEQLKKVREQNSGEKNGFYGKRHNKESKQKISASVKAHYLKNPYYHANRIYCIEEDQFYMSQKDFAKDKGISTSLVSAILRGTRKQIDGFTIERR